MRLRKPPVGTPGSLPADAIRDGHGTSGVSSTAGLDGETLALAVRGVGKVFGQVVANDRLDLDIRPGRIHGLLGENGAGKSTVIKILGGIYRPDSGQILLSGREVSIDSPYQASELGIEIVHQESILIPSLSIAENIALRRQILGRLPGSLSNAFVKTAAELGFELNPNSKVSTLSIGERQRADIVIAMMGDAKVIILDEPTPIMGPDERVSFFAMLRRFAEQGKAIIIVTHRLLEAVEECDDITVLRAGHAVATWTSKAFPTEGGILDAMIGSSDLVRGDEAKRPLTEWTGAATLSVRDVTLRCSERLTVRLPQLDVRPGEIVGVAGIEGSGQRELAALLVGQRRADSGAIQLLGKDISTFSERELCSAVGDVPDEPSLACAAELNIWQNLSMPELLWQPAVGPGKRRELKASADGAMRLFNVKAPNATTQVANLSGGNKRRVVLARETHLKSPSVIVLTYATRGLDARAGAHLLTHIQTLANAGTAIVFISSDLDELLTICDNVAVIVDGTLGDTVPAAGLNQMGLAAAMLGLSGADTTDVPQTNGSALQ